MINPMDILLKNSYTTRMKTNTSTLVIGIGIVLLGAWFVWQAMSSKSSNDVEQPNDTTQAVELVGTNWKVATVAGVEPVSGTTAFVQFGADGRLSGSDGCNNFSTSYTVDGDMLEVDPAMVATKMACEPAVMEQADAITALLLASTRYSITGDVLSLQQGETVGLTMQAGVADLANTSWTIVSYNNGAEAVVSVIEGTNPTILFGADGELSGSAGCNNFFGTYQLDQENISIGTLGSTEMFCEAPEGAMDQETALLAALPMASTWQILGDELWLRSAEDAIVIIASPAESITQ